MLLYRKLSLAVLISLASIVLADVIVQPGYSQQYGNYPQHQTVPQMHSPTEQYHSKANNFHTFPSYKPYETSSKYFTGYPRHHLHYPRYPLYHHRPHYSLNPNRWHFAKIGGRGYEKPSVYLGYPLHSVYLDHPEPLVAYSRSKRSLESDPAKMELNKSKIAAKDNAVAEKSSVIEAKNLAVDDSLLPENEPTDTNDKRVVNRQVNDNPYLTDGVTTVYYDPEVFNTMKEILKARNPGIDFVPVREKIPEQEDSLPTNEQHRAFFNNPTRFPSMLEPAYDSQYRDAGNRENKISTEEFSSAIEQVNLHLPSGVRRLWNSKYSTLNVPPQPEYRVPDARMLETTPSTGTEQVWEIYDSNYQDEEDAEDIKIQKPTSEQILSLMALIKTFWPKTYPFFINPKGQIGAFQTRAAHQEMYPSQAATNMDMTGMATPRQLKFSLPIPFYSEESASVYVEPSNIKVTPVFTPYTHNWDKNYPPLNTYAPSFPNYDFGWNNQYIDFGTNPPTLHKYPYYVPKDVLSQILTSSSRYSPSMLSQT